MILKIFAYRYRLKNVDLLQRTHYNAFIFSSMNC